MNKGFTLIELLVVLAIMSLMVAIAAPFTVRTIERAELRADARELASDLRALRQRAIDRHETISVSALSEKLWPQNGREARRRAAFVADGNDKTLSFYPDGTSTGGAFRLQEGDRIAVVHVAWLSGFVSSEPPQ